MNGKYHSEYESKKCSVQEVLDSISSDDVIIAGGSALEPQATLSRLHEVANRCENLTVFVALGSTPYPFMMEERYRGVFHTHCNFKMSAGRASHRLGLSDTIPADLHISEKYWAGEHHPNLFICQAAPMDEEFRAGAAGNAFPVA